MEPFSKRLVEVWQEACRHIEIRDFTAAIAPLLQLHLPLESLIVRQLDPRRPVAEGLAGFLGSRGEPFTPPRLDLQPDESERLLAWCRRGAPGKAPAGRRPRASWAILLPPEAAGDVLVGPLAAPSGPLGVLVLTSSAPGGFDARHEKMLQALLEPFSVALENDHRLRELGALREAAEAEKRSLLARLGRSEGGEPIIGADAGLRRVLERVELVTRSDLPVLILGETGTGKEVIARAIHSRSPRAAGPFLRVNCGAIPSELIDSQLFGHERGSFTGATEARKGWFERADGGTLFLDEIGELPLAAQVRLLRILQDGLLERLGGEEATKVDVRVVAATHRDLALMAQEGRFREDLWYRIAVFPIVLPPLRERTEDIAALALHFARRAAARFGLHEQVPTGEDIALLASYPWPGNVRELATVIDRAALLGDGARLEIAKALGLSPPSRPAAAMARAPAASGRAEGPARLLSLDAAMKQHVEAALAVTMGRVEGPHGAAALLEINPHTLRARMRKLKVDWRAFRPGGGARGEP